MYEDDEQQYAQEPRTRFFAGFVSGVMASAIAAAVLIFILGNGTSLSSLFNRQKQSANATPTSPAQTNTPSATAPVPPVSAPATAPSAASPPAPPLTPTAPASNAPQASPLPPASPATSAAPTAPAAALPPTVAASPSNGDATSVAATAPAGGDPGAQYLAEAHRYLEDRSRPGDAEAARHLWSAVQQGNLNAEILLAGMYSRGQGVAKNCSQARVLLSAAARKGSHEATQQLAQVVRSGC